MKLNRRAFLTLLVAPPKAAESLQAAVLETFGNGNSTRAILVHHADPAKREVFGNWMRNHLQSTVRIRAQTGDEETAVIFRVRSCFGRGLILLDRPMQVRERDILMILM
jgi:hypothetical protein